LVLEPMAWYQKFNLIPDEIEKYNYVKNTI
jgi:hypothetical protein